MPSARFSLTRLQVYVLLVDPELGGLSQSLAAERLKLNRSTVSEHVKFLESKQFIKPVAGCRCPILYTKAARSPELDALVVERSVRDSVRTCVGHAIPPKSSGLESSDLSHIENAHAHANGSVTFNVEKVGDLHELLVRNDDGEKRVKLFRMDPEISEEAGRGSTCYNAHLYFHGKKVRLQFWQGKKKSTLRVWPAEKSIPPNLLPGDDALECYMESHAQDVANFISKYGGWRFGLPSFNGQIEITSNDERIISQIPDDIRRIEGIPDAWVDQSEGKGKKHFESTSTKKALAVFEFDKTADEVDGHAKRIYVLESNFEHIVSLLEKITRAESMEAELHAAAVSRTVEETAGKIEHRSAAVASESSQSSIISQDTPTKERYGVEYIG